MAQALRLASKGLYTTDPNPRVGCVLVKNERIVGEGFHACAGQAHAEIHALNVAGNDARDATAYVTLEPCSFHGRTPPCSDALISAGVSRVVVAMEDPNPRVSGQGIAALKSAGITVHTGLLADQAEALNCGFVKRMTVFKPWVRIKSAMSLDGRTALENRQSQWISSSASRRDVQLLRARSSAIMTGIGTVLSDDPSLNVRMSAEELSIEGEVRQPLRIILDSRLRMPVTSRMLQLHGETLVITSDNDARRISALERAGAEVFVVTAHAYGINLPEIMQELAKREINEVQVEAGAQLSGSLLEQGLVDEMVLYLAPHLMGSAARGLADMPGIQNMSDRYPLKIHDVRRVGNDVRITARPIIEREHIQ